MTVSTSGPPAGSGSSVADQWPALSVLVVAMAVAEGDAHVGVGIGRAPDGQWFVPLHDHVTGERRRQSDGGRGVRCGSGNETHDEDHGKAAHRSAFSGAAKVSVGDSMLKLGIGSLVVECSATLVYRDARTCLGSRLARVKLSRTIVPDVG